ncbi:MAG: hypothetical protein ACI9O8_001610, partial [Patiriisocius sp.]
MNIAMEIMTLFSINVAWVIGSFKTVPRQAHFICFFCSKAIVTPIVVILNSIQVTSNT